MDQSYSPRVCHFRSQSLIIQLNRLSKIAIHFDTSAGHAFAISVYTENRFAFDEEPLSFICCFAKKSKIKMVLLSLLWQKMIKFFSFNFQKESFHIYCNYCQNSMKSEKLRSRIGEHHPFFVECQRKLGHRLSLGAYLLKPIQRLTKYQLLLQVMKLEKLLSGSSSQYTLTAKCFYACRLTSPSLTWTKFQLLVVGILRLNSYCKQ